MKNQFSLQDKATIGADFLTKLVQHGQDSIQLQLWDTAGAERFNSMGASFYRNTECCVLVFDLTGEESFKNIDIWRNEFLRMLIPPEGDKYPFVLIGNKCDKSDIIKITKQQIDAYCISHNNIPYFAASAKEAINLEEAFNKIADLAYERNKQSELDIMPIQPKYLKFDVKEGNKKKKCG